MLYSSSKIFALVAMTTFTLASCSDDVELTVAENELDQAAAAKQLVQGQVDLALICNTVSVKSATGMMLQGTKDCSMLETKACSINLTKGCYVKDPQAPKQLPTDTTAAEFDSEINIPDSNEVPPELDIVVVKASDLNPAYIRKGIKIGDVTGTYEPPAAPEAAPICSSDGQQNCVTDATFVAAKLSNITGSALRTGSQIAGVAGTLATCAGATTTNCVAEGSLRAVDPATIPVASLRANANILGRQGTLATCSAGTNSDCVAEGAFKAINPTSLPLASIRADQNILGQQGTLANCSATTDANCVADGSFKGIDPATIPVASLRSSASILGRQGTVIDCDGDNTTGCYAAGAFQAIDPNTLPVAKIQNDTSILGKQGTLKTCNVDGEVGCVTDSNHKAVKLANFATTDYKAGVFIAGVEGALTNCADGDSGSCVLPSDHKAVQASDLHEGNIKNGFELGGVTGKFPSSSYKLPDAGLTPLAINTTNFATRIKAGDTFEFFDETGERHTANGSALLLAGNIKKDVVIFGVTGAHEGTGGTVAEWDLRAGVNVGGVGGVDGKLQAGCGKAPCSGKDYFLDVSTDAYDKRTSKSCKKADSSEHRDCAYKDRSTRLIWTDSLATGVDQASAESTCNGLNNYANTTTVWRLPTIFELSQLVGHGIVTFDGQHQGSTKKYWSASDSGNGASKKTAITFSDAGYSIGDYAISSTLDVICVTEAP